MIAESKDAQGTCIQKEMLTFANWQTDPTHRCHPKEMPMREHGNRPLQLPKSCEQPVGAQRNLFHRFTVRATVLKQVPLPPLRMNRGARPSFVVAVVPFLEIR